MATRPKISRAKAEKMLSEGMVRGHKITQKQRGLFAVLAQGKKPTRVKKK